MTQQLVAVKPSVDRSLLWGNQYSSGWTKERTEKLHTKWAAGKSASVIAAEINVEEGRRPKEGLTRNAVIGKAHRETLPKRHSTRVAKKHYQPKVAKPKAEKPKYLAFVDKPRLADQDIPIAQRKTILQLDRGVCHYPVGRPAEPGFFYCGGTSVVDLPYCDDHCRIVYHRS